MAAFILITNTALTILVGLGIYSFSQSILWAAIGAMLVTGSASANPIFALLAYPAIEYFFNHGNLTIYSTLTVGLSIIQLIFTIYMARKSDRSHGEF
jgi:hypothetical protein